ncbi:hypothetical protein KIN20_027899 [Parelaphostrongylus tenuis]|uniref:Uncharacterized protein n=1 Tax=Parelaphostrongylus tenuis TaxID=148309 RepID=A0AAD5WEA9_PARTN|nr:hypothetical protein KIN20_027899 [Parelaphostrongylus tenuis]
MKTAAELEVVTFILRCLRTQGRLDGLDRHSTGSAKEDDNLEAAEGKRSTKSPTTFGDDGGCEKTERMHEVLGDP